MGGIGKVPPQTPFPNKTQIPRSHMLSQEVAKRAKAFGMKIIYNNRHPLSPSITTSLSAHYVSFEELISTSDVISLHLALTPSTERILGAAEFKKMKNGVTIVNTARGDLIDEEAMIEALEKGKVWSLGLDVFDNEPRVDERLLGSERVVVCPHMGAATVETMVS
jgi:glyoxylate reductase